MTDEPSKKPWGLAALSPEKRREIAAMGGRASQQSGKAYCWDSESARVAGRKGGKASRGSGGKWK